MVFRPFPSESKLALISIIIAVNSLGSTDALWSGPSRFLSIVKCFSIIEAPNVVAILGVNIPAV